MRRSAADDYTPSVGRSSPTPIADYWRGLGIRFDHDDAAVPAPYPVVSAQYHPPQPQAGRTGLSRLFSSLSRRKRSTSPGQREGRLVSRPTLSRPDIVVSPPLPDISPFPSTASRNGAATAPLPSLRYQRSLGSLSSKARLQRDEPSYRPQQPPPLPPVPRSAPAQQTAFADAPFPRPAAFGRGSTALPRYDPSMGPPPRPASKAMPAETPFAGVAALKGLGLDFKPADPLAKGSRMSSATLAYLTGTPPKESAARFDAILENEEEERLFGELSPPKKLIVVNATSPDEAHSSEDDASPQLKPFERPLPPPPRPHRRSPNLDRRTPSPRPRSTGSQPGSRPNSTSRPNPRHRPHGSVTEEEEAAAGDVDEYRSRMRSGLSRRSVSPRIAQQEASRPEVSPSIPSSFSAVRLPSFRFSRSGVTLDDVMANFADRMASKSSTPPASSAAFRPSASPSDLARGTTTPSPTFVPVAASPAASTSGVRSSVGPASPHLDKVSPRPRVQSLLASVHLDALGLSPLLAASPRPTSSFSVPVTVAEEEEEDDGPAVVVLPPTPVTAPAADLTPLLPARQPPPRPLSPSSSSSSIPNSSGFSISASQTSLTSFSGTELSCEEAIDSMLDELARPHSPPDLLITHCDDDDDDDEAASSSGERTPTPSSAQKSFSVYQDSALASLARAAEEEGNSPLADASHGSKPTVSAGSVRWSVDSKYSSSSSVYGGADWEDLSGSGGEEEAVLQRKRSVRISRVGATASAKTVVVSAGKPHAPVDAPTRYHSRPLSIVAEEREEADDDDDDDKTVEAVHVVDPPPKSPSKRQSVRNSVVFASKRASVRKSMMLSPEDALATDKLVRELLRRRSAFVCGRFDDVEDGEDDEGEDSVSGSEDEGVVLFGERVKVAPPDDDDAASVVSFGLAY